jgi:transcriptional regulator with XRE-family HTH domain
MQDQESTGRETTMTTATATTSGRAVDAGTLRALRLSYAQLVKAGSNSVRSAWRFGQTLDSFSDAYSQRQIADGMELSVSTIARYLRLFRAYQRPELALEASAQLESFNIDLLVELQSQLVPVEHGRPLAGRHWISTCRNCGSHDVGRDEIPPEDEADEDREDKNEVRAGG